MSRETLIETVEGRVATVTMNRPRRRNAFNDAMYRDMCAAFEDALADDGIGAVVVTGAEGAFSSGQDLEEMASLSPTGGGGHGAPAFMDLLTRFDKPLLAAVNGVGVGLGFTMLLHCDIVYIAEGARLRVPFVPLGVVPEAASSYLLPAAVGHQRAAEIFFTAEWIDAARAVELGIASRLLPAAEVLRAAQVRAAEIAAQPLGALRHTKRLMLAARQEQVRVARVREDEAFIERMQSDENREALAAFLDKSGKE